MAITRPTSIVFQTLLATGVLKAAGPFKDTRPASAMMIFSGESREEVFAITETDPFVTAGHIERVTVDGVGSAPG